jgi:hypothetical protein
LSRLIARETEIRMHVRWRAERWVHVWTSGLLICRNRSLMIFAVDVSMDLVMNDAYVCRSLPRLATFLLGFLSRHYRADAPLKVDVCIG